MMTELLVSFCYDDGEFRILAEAVIEQARILVSALYYAQHHMRPECAPMSEMHSQRCLAPTLRTPRQFRAAASPMVSSWGR